MNITPPTFNAPLPALSPPDPAQPKRLAEASRQFEAVMLRQFLSESLKSLTDHGASGQVYGYFLNDSIADSISKGGGLGLASVFQAQIAGQKGAL